MRQQHHSISRLGAVVAVFACVLMAGTASSIDVSVSATVPTTPPETPPTKVHFTGRAYPGSAVHILKNTVEMAVTQADPVAMFDVELTVDPGNFTFSLFATDANGIDGKSFQVSLMLAEGSTTTVSGIFLAPTIDISDTNFSVGDTITIFGQTIPNSTVTVTVNSDPTSKNATSDAQGIYQTQFIAGSGSLVVGLHSGNARTTAADTQVSETSNTVAFAIGQGPTCGAGRGDLDCDGHVDLVDFSILLFYWNAQNPERQGVDINGDGVVNIVDFSIMLYYWTD